MSLKQNLSNFLSATRYSRQQSISEFSDELDISRSALQNILNGKTNVRLDTVSHLANKLNVDPSIMLLSDYSRNQLEFALLLLQSIEAFNKLPKEKRTKAANLFHELLMTMAEDGGTGDKEDGEQDDNM